MAKTKIRGSVDLTAPWQPAECDPADVNAIQAMARGEATATQQGRVIRWLARATDCDGMAFRPGPDGQRATDFALGKQFVGKQFFTLAAAVLPTRGTPTAAPGKDTPQ